SKKKQDLIDSLRADFIAGAQREGVGEDGVTPIPAFSEATAQRLWTAFEGSGRYSFNKSHTTAYGVIAYQTAYLKANWPAEFGAAVLRFTGSGTDKAHLRVATIRSLRGEGIEVMAPDINTSDEHTVARDGKVWLGLARSRGSGRSPPRSSPSAPGPAPTSRWPMSPPVWSCQPPGRAASASRSPAPSCQRSRRPARSTPSAVFGSGT